MKKFPALVTLLILAPILASCTPAPEEVCEHVLDVLSEQFTYDGLKQELLLKKERGEEVEAMPSEEEFDKEMAKNFDECIIDLEKAKEKDASAYKKRASCAMAAKTFEDFGKCK